MSEQTARGLGLDFGAGECRVAVLEGGEFHRLDLSLEIPRLFIRTDRSPPSDGDRLTGSLPFRAASLKDLLGTDEVLDFKGMKISVQETTRRILGQVKVRIEQQLQAQVNGLAITVPPCAADRQRAALKAAAQAAGFREARLVEDSRAAALAYLHTHSLRGIWIVYGLGRSSFFVSLMDSAQGLTTLALLGDSRVGGQDFDTRIVSWLMQQGGLPVTAMALRSSQDLAELFRLAEKAKVELSNGMETDIPLAAPSASGLRPAGFAFTRETFDTLIAGEVQHTIELTRQAIAEAGLTAPRIDSLFFLGLSTRIPLIRQRVQEFIGRRPEELPVPLVAEGAALYATQMGPCFERPSVSHVLPPRLPSAPPPAAGSQDSLANLSEVWKKLRQAMEVDDPDAAINAYHQFIEAAASPLAGLYRKKAAQLAGLGQVQAATELLEKGTYHFPDRPLLMEKLADLYYQFAQDHYQRACRSPASAKKYLNLCLEFLTKCLHYHRHHPQAMELKKLLETQKRTRRRWK